MNPNDNQQFITLCKNEYRDNDHELKIIHEFEQHYSKTESLSWFMKKSFIYRILHKAFLTQDVDLLLTLRFFIQDIVQQIKQNHCSNPKRVYHTHLMTFEELNLIENSIGYFISINSFLSTCLDRDLALFHLYEPTDLQRVLIEIDVNDQLNDENSLNFIKLPNYCNENEQIIFALGSIFRIESVVLNDDDIWVIQFKYCTKNDTDLKPVFDILKKEYNYDQEKIIFAFGEFLIKLNYLNEAEKYYHRLIDELFHQSDDIIQCYNTLGRLAKLKHDYESSFQWFTKSIKLKPQYDFYLIESYENLANIYEKNGDFKHAIESYNEALTIFIKNFGDNHPNLVICLNNIAIAYKRQKRYTEALECHQKALHILEKSETSNPSDIGILHNNIGVIYRHLGNYDLAIEHYQQALEVYKKCLSLSYSDIGRTFRNIGLAYRDKNDSKQASLWFKKSAIIYRRILSPEDSDLSKIEEQLRNASFDST